MLKDPEMDALELACAASRNRYVSRLALFQRFGGCVTHSGKVLSGHLSYGTMKDGEWVCSFCGQSELPKGVEHQAKKLKDLSYIAPRQYGDMVIFHD